MFIAVLFVLHQNQKLQTFLPVKIKMKKVVYLLSGICYSNENVRVLPHSMGGPHKYSIGAKKARTKHYILNDSIHIKFKNK